MIEHHLNRELEVWRNSGLPDGSGGEASILTLAGTVPAKVDQPSASEQQVAAQWQSEHTHNVYCAAFADVQRGDELRGDGQTFRVLAVLEPSQPRYRKAQCQLAQHEGM